MFQHRANRAILLYALSLLSVGLVTLILFVCQQFIVAREHVPYVRPYGIVYVIPIALLTSVGGVRVGAVTLALSAVLLEYVLFAPHFSWRVSHPRDWAELVLLLGVGGLVIYSMDAVRRNGQLSVLADDAQTRLRLSEERRLAFNREVLLAVTGGRLLLCSPDELSRMVTGAPTLTCPLTQIGQTTLLRRALRSLAAENGLEGVIRLDDALTATMEAATNAVKHGKDGQARVWVGREEISVLVSDRGTGIQPHDLARATLESGFSSQSTLGMGYHLMLQTVDLLALSTSEAGTDILLKVGSRPLPTAEEQFLAQFSLPPAA